MLATQERFEALKKNLPPPSNVAKPSPRALSALSTPDKGATTINGTLSAIATTPVPTVNLSMAAMAKAAAEAAFAAATAASTPQSSNLMSLLPPLPFPPPPFPLPPGAFNMPPPNFPMMPLPLPHAYLPSPHSFAHSSPQITVRLSY